jgi:hypothetical protein
MVYLPISNNEGETDVSTDKRRAQVAAMLAQGPIWLRSLHTAKPVYTAMFDDDEVAFVEPPNGYGRNMCALTTTGARRYGIDAVEANAEPSRAELTAALADRVADGQSIDDAGKALGMTRVRARSLWKRFRDEMGEQAA